MLSVIVLSNVLYSLREYEAADSHLTVVYLHFLRSCHKQHFISYPVDIFCVLEKQIILFFRNQLV